MYTEFEAFLRNQEKPPPPAFDFGSSSTPSTPSLFAFPSSFPSASPPTGSSSSQDSPSSSIPTEDEIFCILNGFCNDGTVEGALRAGGGGTTNAASSSFSNRFEGMDHDLAMMTTGRGRESAMEGFSEPSRPASAEFQDLDPFLQFGAPALAASSSAHSSLGLQAQQHLPFDPSSSSSSSTPLPTPIPIPSFLLSSYNTKKPSYYAHLDPLFANPSPSYPRPTPHFHHSSSSSSSTNDATDEALAALFPPRREPTPLPKSTAAAPPTTKRKASSAAYKPTKANGGKKKGPTDHNIIERKYRDSVNNGFAQLRDSVPVLRVLFGTITPATLAIDTPSPITGLIDGLEEETKQGKATVLGAARDYIDFLQEQRSKQARHIEFLESRMSESQKQILRNAFESFERQIQPPPVQQPFASSSSVDLSSPFSSTSATAPPSRKRTRSAKDLEPDNLASDGGKVLLGVFALFSLFGGGGDFAARSSTEEAFEGGKVLGMSRRAVEAEGWSWDWKVVVGLLVCLLVLPSMRRLVVGMFGRWRAIEGSSREAAKTQRLEGVLGEEEVDVEELRRELGALRGVRGLTRGIVVEWSKGLVGRALGARRGGTLVDVERRSWERVAEMQMGTPTDLKSYLTSLYTYLHLFNLSQSSSTPSPRTLSLLSLLSVSLAGGEITSSASSLWASARAALPSSPTRPEDRTMAEILELTLTDVFAISSHIFTTPSAPLESIAASLLLRDILHVWQALFSSFAPLPSTISTSSSSVPLIDVIAPPTIFTDPSRQAVLSNEIASLVASTTPGSEAHELALVCSGGFAMLTRDKEGLRWSVGRLVGQGVRSNLGEGGKALIAVAGGLIFDDLADNEPSLSDSNPISQQINIVSTFLITYQSFILSLPTSLAFTSKPSHSTRDILPRTLHFRALLNSPDFDSDVGGSKIDEDAKERFVDGLYGLGRWSAGWKDGTDVDSGYSE